MTWRDARFGDERSPTVPSSSSSASAGSAPASAPAAGSDPFAELIAEHADMLAVGYEQWRSTFARRASVSAATACVAGALDAIAGSRWPSLAVAGAAVVRMNAKGIETKTDARAVIDTIAAVSLYQATRRFCRESAAQTAIERESAARHRLALQVAEEQAAAREALEQQTAAQHAGARDIAARQAGARQAAALQAARDAVARDAAARLAIAEAQAAAAARERAAIAQARETATAHLRVTRAADAPRAGADQEALPERAAPQTHDAGGDTSPPPTDRAAAPRARATDRALEIRLTSEHREALARCERGEGPTSARHVARWWLDRVERHARELVATLQTTPETARLAIVESMRTSVEAARGAFRHARLAEEAVQLVAGSDPSSRKRKRPVIAQSDRGVCGDDAQQLAAAEALVRSAESLARGLPYAMPYAMTHAAAGSAAVGDRRGHGGRERPRASRERGPPRGERSARLLRVDDLIDEPVDAD